MPPRDWLLRVEDMIAAIEKVIRHTRGMTLDAFAANEMVREVVYWNFTVIGEAASGIPNDVQERYPDIDWYQMRGMRNRLVHEYFGADTTIVWQTIQEDLPPTLTQLRAVLRAEDRG